MRTILLILVLLFTQLTFAQWNPDAGLIKPLSSNASIEVSSGSNKESIMDGNLQTFWESTNLLPTNYTTRSDLNIFLDKDKYNIDNRIGSFGNAFDGITSSKSLMDDGTLEIVFKKPEHLFLLSIKLNAPDTVWVTITGNGKEQLITYLPSENYSLRSIDLLDYKNVYSIKLYCKQSFEVFEIAGLSALPTEEVVFDLKKLETVGWIGSRHYNGDGVISISVLASKNKESWNEIATLNPLATAYIPQIISPEVVTRYIKIKFVLTPRIYQKAKLIEFDLYDKYGPYGKPLPVRVAKKTYSQSFGINTIWGWGYSVYSDQLTNKTGPWLFNRVASLVRNYHNINWDITRPDENPGFKNMQKGNGTAAKSWLNWDREYEIWKSSGFNIDACIMFNNQNFPDTLWHNTFNEAMQYGTYFTSHFSESTSLISIVEVGNEPWGYSKSVYRTILAGMSKGLKDGSKELTILPCATQAYRTSLVLNNYISDYLVSSNSSNIDGLNTHIYSYVYNNESVRIAVNPEDPRSEVWSVNNLQRFSDVNLSGKPVYVTEFGYDSDGGGDDCTHDVCITEFEQAIYGSRMTLILYRLGVEQFYWYYFANVDYTSIMHNRSGLTASYSNGFKQKLSFYSFQLLQELLGDYYFHHIIREDNEAYIYAYSDSSGSIKRIVAWRPTHEDHNNNLWISFPFNEVIEDAVSLVPEHVSGENTAYVRGVNELKISLSGVPVIIKIKD